MKVQFGIDTSALNPNLTHDATVDCWTNDNPNLPNECPVNLPAVGTTPAVNILDWTPATLIKIGDPAFAADIPASALNRIIAVRIGLVVRSDEPDFRDPTLFVAPAKTLSGPLMSSEDTPSKATKTTWRVLRAMRGLRLGAGRNSGIDVMAAGVSAR